MLFQTAYPQNHTFKMATNFLGMRFNNYDNSKMTNLKIAFRDSFNGFQPST